MKVDRLIAIIMLLLQRDTISTKELSERLEVSRRTIFRDIDTLSIAGMPIMVTKGAMGGVGLMKSYKVDKKLFTPKDVQSLITSLQSYNQVVDSKEITNTLAKLLSMTEKDDLLKKNIDHQKFSMDFELSEGNRSLRSLIMIIDNAMDENRYLFFNYIDKNGQETRRKVEPYKVVFKESRWYLQAFSVERDDYRIFKLARMSELRLAEETFTPRNFEALPMDGSDWMTKEFVPVIIKIDKSIKDKVIERFGEESIIGIEGNSYIARYPITDNEEGYNKLLDFGRKCELIEPISMRQNFKKYLLDVMEMYK